MNIQKDGSKKFSGENTFTRKPSPIARILPELSTSSKIPKSDKSVVEIIPVTSL